MKPKVGQDLQGQRRSHGQPQPGHPDHLEAPEWHFWEKGNRSWFYC